MIKKSLLFFTLIAYCALFVMNPGITHAGITEARAATGGGVQHKEGDDHDGHDHTKSGHDEKKSGPHTDAGHEDHDHGKKADEHKEHDDHTKDGEQEKHEQHAHDSHGHTDGGSDLDRSVEDLWAAKCEHDILHYTCEECRYELGVVKLSDTIFAAGDKPDLLTVASVERQNFSRPLQLTGEVALDESRTVRISMPLQGTITRLVADIGQRVEQGALLLELDSTDAADAKGDYLKKAGALSLARKAADREAALFAKKISAEAEVLEAKTRLKEAEIEHAGARARLARLGFSAHDIDSLSSGSAGALIGTLPVYATKSGLVLERYGTIGERVEAGRELMLLSDLSEVRVWADIRETDLHLLPGGGKLACEVEMPGMAGKKYSGTLDVVTGVMNEQTRTVRARISVPNTDGQLRPGIFVNITVLLQGQENVLAVPQVALLTDAGRDFVFIHKEGEYWIRRPVEKGDSFGRYVAIKQGLTEGQKIISDGSFLLKSDVLRSKMGAGCAD